MINFTKLIDLSRDRASSNEIVERIKSGAEIKGTNMVILILAMFIASIGLNMNSTAVVIGAMLISPLMGVIMGLAYGIATYDTRYSRTAFLRLAFQTVFCILSSTIYFAISPIDTPSSELLARTSPSIWDVLIAIFGGFAGIIGITREEKSNVIPGVAIATALMPPLCTAGYGLANHLYSFFFGAIYLYFINCLFICLTSLIVIKILKIPVHKYSSPEVFKNQKLILITLSIITIIPSLVAAYTSVQSSLIQNQVSNYINYQGNLHDNRQVVSQNINSNSKVLTLTIIGKKVTDDQLNIMTEDLQKYSYLKDYKLKIIQNQDDLSMQDLEKFVDNKLESSNQDQNNKSLYMQAYQLSLKNSSAVDKFNEQAPVLFPAIVKVKGSIISNDNDKDTPYMFLAIVYVKDRISAADAGKLKAWFSKDLDMPVELVVQKAEKNSDDLVYGDGVAW